MMTEMRNLFELYRNDAREQYNETKQMIDGLSGKVNELSIKQAKAGLFINAGIFNKNKETYEKGLKKFYKVLFEIEENARENENMIYIDPYSKEGEVLSHKKEQGYLQICNQLKEMKKEIEKRDEHLKRFNYFESNI